MKLYLLIKLNSVFWWISIWWIEPFSFLLFATLASCPLKCWLPPPVSFSFVCLPIQVLCLTFKPWLCWHVFLWLCRLSSGHVIACTSHWVKNHSHQGCAALDNLHGRLLLRICYFWTAWHLWSAVSDLLNSIVLINFPIVDTSVKGDLSCFSHLESSWLL